MNVKAKIHAINLRKEKSPSLTCLINSFNIVCVVDKGSKINCLSYNFAKKANIPIDKVSCTAVGANKSPMNVVGVTKYDIYASVVGTRVPADINLSRMVVIDDLGADALLGMLAKIDNKIVMRNIARVCLVNQTLYCISVFLSPYLTQKYNSISTTFPSTWFEFLSRSLSSTFVR